MYQDPGTYTVNLTAINLDGTNSKLGTITVLAVPILPAANFSANVTEGYAPLAVQFTNTSENTTSVSWDFNNDGISDSTEGSPVYVYQDPGTYTVNLTANPVLDGTNSKLGTITVLAVPVFPGYTNPPTDLNNDGLYEDVNGDGMLDFNDVVAYYDNINWIKENALVAFFDFNNDSLIDVYDIVILYEMTK